MPAIFPQLPKLLPLGMVDGKRIYQLREDLHHYDGVIPEGFTTDLASIPRIFRPLPGFGHDGPSMPAALIHDHDYAFSKGSRREADQRFLRNMRYTGVGLLLRYAIYRGVRIGGGKTWRSNRS